MSNWVQFKLTRVVHTQAANFDLTLWPHPVHASLHRLISALPSPAGATVRTHILIDMLQRSNLFIEVEFNLKSLAPEEPPVIWSYIVSKMKCCRNIIQHVPEY